MNYIFEIVMLFSMSTSNQGDTAGDLLPGKTLQTCSNLFKPDQTCLVWLGLYTFRFNPI